MGGGANGDRKGSSIGDLPPLPTRFTAAQLGIPLDRLDTSGADESPELADAVDMDDLPFTLPVSSDYYPPDLWNDMDDFERGLPPSQLYKLFRKQIQWAEEEADALNEELTECRTTAEDLQGRETQITLGDDGPLDATRRFNWTQTEHLLDTLMEAEVSKVEKLVGLQRLGGDTNAYERIKGLEAAVRSECFRT